MSNKTRKTGNRAPSRSSDVCEVKFMQAVQDAAKKSTDTRTQALRSLCDILVHHYTPHLVKKHEVALGDCVEKAIRRGKGSEQLLAANLAVLLRLQSDKDLVKSKPLSQALLTVAADKSAPCEVRAKCCTAMGVLSIIETTNLVDGGLMKFYERIFNQCQLNNDDADNNSLVICTSPVLQKAALSAWALLLTCFFTSNRVTATIVGKRLRDIVPALLSLLQSQHLEVRTAAGETMALVFEYGHLHGDQFLAKYVDEVIDAVAILATASHKHYAKRDRKNQRATFRDVLRYLADNITPEINVHFGKECMLLDSWAKYHRYSSICAVMGPGMDRQLQENNRVREYFDLGQIITTNATTLQIGNFKVDSKLPNAAVLKQHANSHDKKPRGQLSTPEKNVRYGKASEQLWGVKLASLLELLLRSSKMSSKLMLSAFRPWGQPRGVHAKCCTALALTYLLESEENDASSKLIQVLEFLENNIYVLVVSGGYHTPEKECDYIAALYAWGILFASSSAKDFIEYTTWKRKTNGLLHSAANWLRLLQCPYLETRIVVAETLALVLECGRLHDVNFFSNYLDDFTTVVRQLYADVPFSGTKMSLISQKERCLNVIRYLEDGIKPTINVRINNECLVLDSWVRYNQYTNVSVEVGAEMASYLEQKQLIPDIFKYKIVNPELTSAKQTKSYCDLLNAIACRQRTLMRRESRQKRTANFS